MAMKSRIHFIASSVTHIKMGFIHTQKENGADRHNAIN
jgi:hypothetical protein